MLVDAPRCPLMLRMLRDASFCSGCSWHVLPAQVGFAFMTSVRSFLALLLADANPCTVAFLSLWLISALTLLDFSFELVR